MMNQNLVNNIGKNITVTHFAIVNGEQKIEYIQGTLKDVIEDIITIEQYIPYLEYLKGNKPQSIKRVFYLSTLREIKID